MILWAVFLRRKPTARLPLVLPLPGSKELPAEPRGCTKRTAGWPRWPSCSPHTHAHSPCTRCGATPLASSGRQSWCCRFSSARSAFGWGWSWKDEVMGNTTEGRSGKEERRTGDPSHRPPAAPQQVPGDQNKCPAPAQRVGPEQECWPLGCSLGTSYSPGMPAVLGRGEQGDGAGHPGSGAGPGLAAGIQPSFKLISHIISHLGCCVWIKPGTWVSSQHR